MTSTTTAAVTVNIIKIRLTDRAPVKVREALWPVIAEGVYKHWDNQYEFQANRTWTTKIRVRRHADGRAIVYGFYTYETAFQGETDLTMKEGDLITPDHCGDIVAAIRGVAERLAARLADYDRDDEAVHVHTCATECIGDLPAETLD